MIKTISKSEAIKAKLNQGIKTYLDTPEHIMSIDSMNKQLESFRREFQVKERNSQISAANVILQHNIL
jgi:hypothetical protein